MITEDYVSFETAKLLKEKGFKEITQGYINTDKEIYMLPFQQGMYELGNKQYLYPTIQMAMKWLRKIYSLEIYPYHDFPKVGDKWWFEIIKYPNTVSEYESETVYNSYEEACEAAIKYCLENLI